MNLLVKKGKEEVFNTNELTKKFLEYIDVSQKTIDSYAISLRQFANYMKDNDIKQPTREDIINYREYLKSYLKPTTVNAYLIAVRNFFKYLEYEGIYKNITENVKDIKLEKKHLKLGLSDEEIEKVLNVCSNNKEVLLVKMIVNLGLRCNEVINIRLDDFYNDQGTIMLKVLGKARDGLKQDSIKINDKLYNAIQEYVKEYNITDYLFVSECHRVYGQQLSTRGLSQIIKDLFKKAELDDIDLKSLHSLRHSCCEMLLDSGVPIQEVSEYLRHKSLNTVMVYSRELNQRKSQCSNLLADKLF